MSRIGRLPIDIPQGVEVKIEEGNKVTVKGPKGTLEKNLPVEMEIKLEDNQIVVSRPNDLKKMKSLHGLTRSFDRQHGDWSVSGIKMKRSLKSTVLVTEHRKKRKRNHFQPWIFTSGSNYISRRHRN